MSTCCCNRHMRKIEGALKKDVQNALLACCLIVKEITNHFKPAASFGARPKLRDETPYNLNTRIEVEEAELKKRAKPTGLSMSQGGGFSLCRLLQSHLH